MIMKKTLLPLLLMLTFLCADVFAQNKIGKISGTIVDDKQKVIDGATVSLNRSKDGGLVKVGVTDKKGNYEFEKIPERSYIVTFTVTGFQKKTTDSFSISADKPTIALNSLTLSPVAKSLGEVTVMGKRPLIENKIDRTVVNVEAAPSNAGASALEV